ncbi:MAG TPA: 4Fe-4S dicluster domain-containing protein, partial [Oceanospirillales bacterium]|nr:4Fe-4S dicluster domain-containing protein [Oceanospirillales bacterium]
KAINNVVDWNDLNMNFDIKAKINQDSCIECGRCHIACEDTSHQAIEFKVADDGKRTFTVIDDECVGCNLCQHVCPVPDCIEMVEVDNGLAYMNWTNNPLNPLNN